MCDVILAAEDGEVMAHKVILMAVSKYFREKLSPVISSTATRVFLKGIVKFLNFGMPENFAKIYLKCKQRDQTVGYLVKKMPME